MIRINRDDTVVKENNPTITEELIAVDGIDFYAMEYRPIQRGPRSHVAVVLMHCDQNYMGMEIGPGLAREGYHTLAVESIESGDIDRKILRLDRMLRYLKQDPTVENIVLLGHSGGATLMTAYQALAENGPEVFQKDSLVYRCTVTKQLVAADGILLLDANYGNAVMTLLSLDPAIKEEGNGINMDPALDPFDPANGYDPKGANYSADFLHTYHAAQRQRNDRLIVRAQERLQAIEAGEGNYTDDEPFIITAANQPKPNNRLLPQDLHLLSHTKGEYDLLHGDGTITHEKIYCLRTPEIDHSFSMLYDMGANRNTVRGFLSSEATRTTEDFAVTEDEVKGIEWRSSYATPIGNVELISVPALIMGMTGSYEYLAAEMLWQHAHMKDKSIAFVRGAGHNFTPNHNAEKTPGEFGDTEGALFRYAGSWLEERFV